MALTFEREALYEEVWTMPLTKLGQKYGLSDNGMRKICKALNIPLPVAGHWAKVAAGKPTRKRLLPANAGRTTFVSSPPPAPVKAALPEDECWISERIASEKRPENEVKVDPSPTRWHKAIARLRSALAQAAKEHAKAVAERDAAAARRAKMKNPGPNFDAFKWGHLDNGLIYSDRVKSCLRVSILTYERALAIANAIFLGAEARGFVASVDEKAERLSIEIEGCAFNIAIRERQSFDLVARPHPFASLGPERKYKPTNKLAIVVARWPGGDFEIVDTPAAPVEGRLNSLFVRLYQSVLAARERRREDEARELRQIAYRAEAQALAKQREAEREAEEARRKQRNELLSEASRWSQAKKIHDYVAAVAAGKTASQEAHRNLVRWAAWALSVADEINPLKSRLKSFSTPAKPDDPPS